MYVAIGLWPGGEAILAALVSCETHAHLAHPLGAFSWRWALFLLLGCFAVHFLIKLFSASQSLALETELDINGATRREVIVALFVILMELRRIRNDGGPWKR